MSADLQRPRVLYLATVDERMRALLSRRCPDAFDLVLPDTAQARAEALPTADAIVSGGEPVDEATLSLAPRLKLVHMVGVGWHDRVAWEVLKRRGIALACCPTTTADAVAEHALMLILAAQRHLSHADAAMRRGEFLHVELRSVSHVLRGRTVGLVGMGRIARQLAKLLRAFDVEGLCYSRSAPDAAWQETGFRYVALDTLLETSDIVSLHLPGTPQTRHIIGRRELMRMKPGSFLVNTARGLLVDEEALVDALRSGQLGGAGLDVFTQEPPSPASALLRLPNVVLTPHIGAGQVETTGEKADFIFGNIRGFFAGQPLLEQVPL
ncbi:2-hydroxyacid dehydrogenase [Xanthobacter aminoxidans]|uniref:2-hydroxyacid dehydrogenase n=1 Tax=Xanthobacter aminoxidans TaxID=186280 RepID=UPI0020230CA4|nr:2-hydroxyacid dehydrogenase [Xanthobacter aminoxidans]